MAGEHNINLTLYDVNGSALLNRNLPNLLHNSDALLFVYDVRHKGSFVNLKEWNQTVKSSQFSALFALIGHKSDLSAVVKIEDLYAVSKDYHITLNTEISPYSDSINNAFVRITKEVLSQPEESVVRHTIYFTIRLHLLKLHKDLNKSLDHHARSNSTWICLLITNGQER